MGKLDHICSVEDFRRLASARLPRPLFDAIDGGSGSELTAAMNISAFSNIKLMNRGLVDVSRVDTSTTVFGQRLKFPLYCSPTGLSRLYHPSGELAVVRACNAAGTAFGASMISTFTHERIAAECDGPKILQIYIFKDARVVSSMIERARQSRYSALCITIDTPVPGYRYRDVRSGLVIPPKITPATAMKMLAKPVWLARFLTAERFSFASLNDFDAGGDETAPALVRFGRQLDPSATWERLGLIAREWGGPLLVKGIMHPKDAELALAHGATAIVVSNHGGRQFDGGLAPIEILPSIVECVNGRAEVYLDGGVRNGSDVIKALALGADAVGIGRPWVFALAAAGEPGVRRLLELFANEIRNGMALMGCRNVSEITRDFVFSKSDGPRTNAFTTKPPGSTP